jgi:hypothetical protein
MSPALAYYRKNEGTWACRLDFRIVNVRAWLRQPMSWRERIDVLATAAAAWLGLLSLRTSVVVESETRVVHTTEIHWRRFMFLRGLEVITLSAGGAEIDCKHVVNGAVRTFAGRAVCSADAKSMTYTFQPWFGSELQQRGVIVDEGANLDQSTPWFQGTQKLRSASK